MINLCSDFTSSFPPGRGLPGLSFARRFIQDSQGHTVLPNRSFRTSSFFPSSS